MATDVMTADAGYWSLDNARHCEASGIDAYISTGRKIREAPPDASVTGDEELADPRAKMREKLMSEEGAAVYRRRKGNVEPPFGQIKEAQGIRTFLLRGIDRVRGEWSLVCTAHNLLKLWRKTKAATA